MKLKAFKRRFFLLICMVFLLFSGNANTKEKGKQNQWEIGVCTGYENSNLLKSCGCSFIEGNVKGILMPNEDEIKFAENLEMVQKASLSVKVCNSFLPSDLKCVGSKTDYPAVLKFAETAFRRAQKAGVEIIVFGSGGARRIPDGFSKEEARKQFIGLCKQMAVIAEKYNVMIVLEPLNTGECNFINSVSEGGEIVKEVNHPNFRLLADLYHMKKDNEGPENILKYGRLLHHVHIAEKEGRSAPGTNGEDFTEYFKALKKMKYDRRISIECTWQKIEEQLPLAIRTIRTQLENKTK